MTYLFPLYTIVRSNPLFPKFTQPVIPYFSEFGNFSVKSIGRFFFCRICQRYIAVREPHRHSYKKVVDVNYDAICENGKICKKTRQEYQTIYRTVYRTTYKCASNEE